MPSPDPHRLLAVDGNSLAYRAWFALVRQQLDGPFVTHGVAGMIATAWHAHGPFDGVVVAFDSPENHRKDRYPDYKAGRPDRDPQLYVQIDRCQQLLGDVGVPVVSEPGWEADDLVASAATTARTMGMHTFVLTSDRDLLQLVDGDTTVLRVTQSIRDARTYTPGDVHAEYGVRADKYVQLAALRGDPSDNLPGVDGVGAKTAAKLIGTYGTIDGLYAHLDDVGGKTAEKLASGRGNVERNLDLMALNRGLDVGLEDLLQRTFDPAVIADQFDAYGLPTAAGRWRGLVRHADIPERPPLPDEPPPDDELPVDDAEPAHPAVVSDADQMSLL